MHDGPSAGFEAHASRRRFLAGAMGMAGALTVSQRTGAIAQEASPEAGDLVELLFVQACESGSAAPVEGEDGVYTLTLVHGAGQTLYFSDRPERIAGIMDTSAFIEELIAIASDPPNAALAFRPSDEDEAMQVAVVEISQPMFDEGTGSVTYQARMIDPAVEGGLTADEAARFVGTLPDSFGQATLFIDGVNKAIIVVNLSGHDLSIGIWKVPPR